MGSCWATTACWQRPRGPERIGKRRGATPHPRAGLWEHLYIDICPPSLQRAVRRGAGRAAGAASRPDTSRPASRDQWCTHAGHRLRAERCVQDDHRRAGQRAGGRADHRRRQRRPGPLDHCRRTSESSGSFPARVLPSCSAVITHGGGIDVGCVDRRLPDPVRAPRSRSVHERRSTVAAGAGLSLLPGELSPDAVRSSLRRLLDEPAFAERAIEISDEITAMPPPQAAIPALERLANSRIS